MNSMIESLNLWGRQALDLAWPMFWQSSLLIVVVLALDLVLRHKVRAAVRYALWLVVLLKLVLPTSLALPTGVAWWLPRHKEFSPPTKPQTPAVIVSHSRNSVGSA